MAKLKQIEEFLAAQPIAMAGASSNPRKFGFAAFRELKEKGMNIIPVNPHAEEIHLSKVVHSLKDLPSEVKSLIIMTRKDQTLALVREAKDLGFKNIWIQQNSESPEVIKELEGSGMNYITRQCILMYFKPHGVHKFHIAIKKLFGGYPK